jgi:hypothetical protein
MMTDEPVSETPSPALAHMQALDALSPMTEQLDAFGVLRGAWKGPGWSTQLRSPPPWRTSPLRPD